MSSTQHQLIEQCATRLRGIVEALDNIHDNTPHRWSTDLDDVHSSAESLLALIKDQAPARSEASFEEWLANELEGEDGQPVPAAVCDIALARRAFNHWPKLEHPAKVGGVRFSAGVSSRLVVEAAQRLYEFESTPEKEAERIERLQAFREQLDPLNLAPHAEAFNEAPADALRPEQAEAERPEVVGYRSKESGMVYEQDYGLKNPEALTTVAECDRIVGELRAENAKLIEALDESDGDRWRLRSERDAALARAAELEGKLAELEKPVPTHGEHSELRRIAVALKNPLLSGEEASDLMVRYEALTMPDHIIALIDRQAQHSVPDGYRLIRLEHFAAIKAQLNPEQVDAYRGRNVYDEDKVYANWNACRSALDEIKDVFQQIDWDAENELAELLAAAPDKEVPQAWLDVQAERRRQVEAEGWTPEHDDEHADGQMAQAAGCYALHAGGIGTDWPDGRQNGSALFWPWDKDSWKPTTPRRDLVKACALALAEIERLDRAGISQSPQPGATTASS
ncbi:Uncharacterised protein [Pseudomonas aeruginosa]|uniref:hypothetical protein n=1 Tax=Pseudomonas aeruginosa TaxID=287 RepID=UPI00071782C4|nr:hypothetical protein [Pseudomonas aeruginosa]KRU72830.1 hypothetical protein AN451_06545 [Pseudomonas aeruginosa]SUC54156.1 Uncharacterised protein [Pseudomonas aeruginosa]